MKGEVDSLLRSKTPAVLLSANDVVEYSFETFLSYGRVPVVYDDKVILIRPEGRLAGYGFGDTSENFQFCSFEEVINRFFGIWLVARDSCDLKWYVARPECDLFKFKFGILKDFNNGGEPFLPSYILVSDRLYVDSFYFWGQSSCDKLYNPDNVKVPLEYPVFYFQIETYDYPSRRFIKKNVALYYDLIETVTDEYLYILNFVFDFNPEKLYGCGLRVVPSFSKLDSICRESFLEHDRCPPCLSIPDDDLESELEKFPFKRSFWVTLYYYQVSEPSESVPCSYELTYEGQWKIDLYVSYRGVYYVATREDFTSDLSVTGGDSHCRECLYNCTYPFLVWLNENSDKFLLTDVHLADLRGTYYGGVWVPTNVYITEEYDTNWKVDFPYFAVSEDDYPDFFALWIKKGLNNMCIKYDRVLDCGSSSPIFQRIMYGLLNCPDSSNHGYLAVNSGIMPYLYWVNTKRYPFVLTFYDWFLFELNKLRFLILRSRVRK